MTRINKITLFIFSIFIINNLSSTSFADESDVRYYDVEIIVFKNTQEKYLKSELWKKNFEQIEPEIYVQIGQPLPIELPENYDPLLSFQYIENTAYQLNDIVTSLNESSRHQVLLHSAWRQPGLSNAEALYVKINHFIPNENPENSENDELLIDQDNLENNQQIETEQLPIENNIISTSTDSDTVNEEGFALSGYIKLVLSRYLHLKIDLIYHEIKNEVTELFISDEFGDDDLLPDIYHINQTRRLRSKELHYIDHPVISIITLITPYKIKKE